MQKMHWNYGIRIRIFSTREAIRQKKLILVSKQIR